MNIEQFAKNILESSSLEEKLNPTVVDSFEGVTKITNFCTPSRVQSQSFSSKQVKFPKEGQFHLNEAKAKALNSFANHELLAIEIMAQSILNFPETNPELTKFRKIIYNTILDEQKHCQLYITYLNKLGYQFGDFPINDYFWKTYKKTNSIDQYFALMSLTFEAANLDFAFYYMNLFKKIGDIEFSSILKTVFDDEISHVSIGQNWLKGKSIKKDIELFDYYSSLLPEKVTPARSKGIHYSEDHRVLANLDQSFIKKTSNYKDDFLITKRKK